MGPGITYSHLFSEIEGIEGVQNGSGDQLKDSMRSKKKSSFEAEQTRPKIASRLPN
jgi:hypothetical protein